MIDAHTHLDLYPNPMHIIEETSRRNHATLCVTTSPRAWLSTKKVLEKYSNIFVALGLHPEIATIKHNELQMLLDNIDKSVFIGEIGIDGSPRYLSFIQLQKDIFTKTFEKCAETGSHIISIHSRNSATTILDIISNNIAMNIPLLHWFSGTRAQLFKAIDLGCYFSYGPAALSSENGRKLISLIPLERLLPESDGPFSQTHNAMVMPWEAINICSYLSQIHHCDVQQIFNQLIKNWNKIFSFSIYHDMGNR